MTKKNTKLLAAYSRVSRVGGRAGDGFISFDDQEDGIRWRARELGITIPEDAWYREPDASGGSFKNRPEWDKMMERINDPGDPLGGFIAVRTDRFSRNVAEGSAVAQQLKNRSLNFVLVDVPVDFSTPEGELMFTQMLAYAQYQLSYLKQSWWRSKKRAINRGAHIGRTPTGFDRITADDGSGKLVPKDEWKMVVRTLYTHADEHPKELDGAIATWANHNAPRPDGKLWYPSLVGRMLASPVYIGRIAYKPREDTDVVWPYDPLENAEAHDAIVDEGLWQRVQIKRVAQQNTNQQLGNVGRPRNVEAPEALLRGLLRCAGCQHVLKPSMGGVRQLTYHCDGGKHRANGPCPLGHRANVARWKVDDYLVKLVQEQLDLSVNAEIRPRTELSDDVAEVQAAVADAEEELGLIRDNTTMAARHYDLWQATVDKAEAKLSEMRAKEAVLLAQRDSPTPDVLAARFGMEDLPVEERRRIIAGAIDYVLVWSGRAVPIERKTIVVWRGLGAKLDLYLPGKGRPGLGPGVPLDYDDVMARILAP